MATFTAHAASAIPDLEAGKRDYKVIILIRHAQGGSAGGAAGRAARIRGL
jgi:hypothetical protein